VAGLTPEAGHYVPGTDLIAIPSVLIMGNAGLTLKNAARRIISTHRAAQVNFK
jgi:hypothetical protein